MQYYICDGSPDGFFTAVFDAYGKNNCLITSSDSVQLTLDSTVINVVADIQKSRRIQTAILKYDRQALSDVLYKITGETHRLKGLLRFIECSGGVLYAPYSPDNNITDLLMPHFTARFSCEKFIIHDTKRKIAGAYNGCGWVLGYLDDAEICLSEAENAVESLWKLYYESVNIDERPHEKQMKRSMPVRYWKFLPEKKT